MTKHRGGGRVFQEGRLECSRHRGRKQRGPERCTARCSQVWESEKDAIIQSLENVVWILLCRPRLYSRYIWTTLLHISMFPAFKCACVHLSVTPGVLMCCDCLGKVVGNEFQVTHQSTRAPGNHEAMTFLFSWVGKLYRVSPSF